MGLFYYDLGKEELLDVFAYEVIPLHPSSIPISEHTLRFIVALTMNPAL